MLLFIMARLGMLSADSLTNSAAMPERQQNTSFDSPKKFRLGGGHVIFSSPTIVDITNDGIPEVIVGTTACAGNPCETNQSTSVEVWQGIGDEWTQLWSTDVGGPVNSSPSVGDIDNDGFMDIVVGVGGDVNDVNQNGGVVALNHLGVEKWRFVTTDHITNSGASGGDGFADGVFSTPSLCDLDGNGTMEIAFGAWDHRIYLISHQGTAIWTDVPGVATGQGFTNGDTVWSSPACADLNRDGSLEVIVGADITSGGILPDGLPAPGDGGFLYVFSANGDMLVRRFIPEAIYSSPAIADLDNDGIYEIVVGTSFSWWNVHGRVEQPYVYAFSTANVFSGMAYNDANKLPDLPGWPKATEYPGFSSPAVADIDNDGDMEVVIGTSHPDLNNDSIPGAGRLHAWHHNGQNVAGWPVSPKNTGGADGPIYASPIIGDIDADGQNEILFSMLWDVQVYEANGTLQEILPTTYTTVGSPAIGDTNNDGKVEIWIGGSNIYNSGFGFLWKFENGANMPDSLPWPMFRGDPAHTGHIRTSSASMSVTGDGQSIFHEKDSGQSYTFPITIRNTGDTSFSWNAANLPSGVQLAPNAGNLAGGQQQTVMVTITGAGRNVGVYNLAPTINATADGNTVTGSPTTVDFTLYVLSDLYQTMMPSVLKP
ncbi:MAG TPA: VCBS repeat-containing protein [Anaerolineae bacterium]|nr:VCBS repeat-containing protein [Anaerolineae bacterium]